MELRLTARRGENVLVTIVIPVVVLLFFASVSVLPTGDGRAGRLPAARRARAGDHRDEPGQPRHRDRLRAELRRPQAARRLAADARRPARRQDRDGPGRRGRRRSSCSSPSPPRSSAGGPGPGASPVVFVVALLLGTLAFAGLGLLLAGALRAEATLALANGLFIASCCSAGSSCPVSHLPGPLAALAGLLPGRGPRRRVPRGPGVGRRAISVARSRCSRSGASRQWRWRSGRSAGSRSAAIRRVAGCSAAARAASGLPGRSRSGGSAERA